MVSSGHSWKECSVCKGTRRIMTLVKLQCPYGAGIQLSRMEMWYLAAPSSSCTVVVCTHQLVCIQLPIYPWSGCDVWDSSSDEVGAEGVGMFVLLTLLVKFVIVLQCFLFYKMYFKRKLVRNLQWSHFSKSHPKEEDKSHFKGCPCFLTSL